MLLFYSKCFLHTSRLFSQHYPRRLLFIFPFNLRSFMSKVLIHTLLAQHCTHPSACSLLLLNERCTYSHATHIPLSLLSGLCAYFTVTHTRRCLVLFAFGLGILPLFFRVVFVAFFFILSVCIYFCHTKGFLLKKFFCSKLSLIACFFLFVFKDTRSSGRLCLLV